MKNILYTEYYPYALHTLGEFEAQFIAEGNDEELKKVREAIKFRAEYNLG